MNIVDSKNIPLTLGNRHYRRKLATLVRRGKMELPVARENTSSLSIGTTYNPVILDENIPTNGYVDARTDDEKNEEPISELSVTDQAEVPVPQTILERIVHPHKTVSREVTQDDVDSILAEGQVLVDLCYAQSGIYQTAFAMAHPQIEEKNPMRIFALANGMIICNPRIVGHTKHPVDSVEGCMSLPLKEKTLVQRYNKIDVEFQTIDNDKKLTEVLSQKLSGIQSKVWQHEIAHLNGHYCFDEDFSPEYSLPVTK